MENIITDVSIKEEDQEIDIEAYSETEPRETTAEAESGEEDELPVDVDKVYNEA
jgi:small subunit ribosomal protein S2